MAALLFLAMSCTTSKSLYKDALKYEEAGLYEDAVNSLERSLQKKYKNTDARVKLQEIGQRVFDMKLDDFNRHLMLKDYAQAVHDFRTVTRFQSELRKYKVELTIPGHYTTGYEEAKETHLSAMYADALTHMQEDRFTEAEDMFGRILDIDANYEDARDLMEGAQCEPIYRTAMNQFDRGDYRTAYYGFLTCARKGDYKDAAEYVSVCLELGQTTVALLPLENMSGAAIATDRMQAYALEALVKMDNPFLRIVERDNLDQVIQEQNFNLSGSVSEHSAIEAGNLVGATTILTAEVVGHHVELGNLQRIKRQGFVSYTVTLSNEDGTKRTVTKYKPVEYIEYEDRNSVSLSFHFKLVDVETAEILTADIIHREEMDQVHFAVFNGDHSKLFPARSDGRVDLNYSNRNRLRGLLSARRELGSSADLADKLFGNTARSMAKTINSELD